MQTIVLPMRHHDSDPVQKNMSQQSISTDEQQKLLFEWNRTKADYPRGSCVHHLIEAQARRTPHAIAIQFDGRTLSYAELDARADQFANQLRTRGVGLEVRIGVYVERSLEMVIALLGILKAGGAYVPLDRGYPSDRIKYILDDARVKVLVTQKSLIKLLPPMSAEVLCIDAESEVIAAEPRKDFPAEPNAANLAYVIYTSGSTGRPKGVQVEHRSVVNFLHAMQHSPGLGPEEVLLAVTTICFDIAGLEMYLPLIVGARVVIASREVAQDGKQLMQLLRASHATVMQATPATWRLLFESGWQGNRRLKVLVGGEALSAELARQLVSHCGPVWNMYGPTETTIWSAVHQVDGRDERAVPIGKPIANTSFYILDGELEPVPLGAEGELYIGGEGLARGYFEREALTAEKFIADPFSSQPGARMYRTGDLARYRRDGNVEFLGRADHQVKIRGFRIELGEIEAVLAQHPGVRNAVVLAREEVLGDQRLVAYVVPEPESVVTSSELRSHLQKHLPDYMMPSAFVQLATLPLTPNGKVDRNALPAPKPQHFEFDHDYVAPRDQVEKKLATLWEEVLEIRPIGVKTNFFDLGGRSLLAARLFMKISRTFGKDLPLATLFGAPTIEKLANELRPRAAAPDYSSLVAIQPDGSKPPFFCVHGGAGSTLFLHRLAREIGSDQPFYGLEPEGLDGKPFQRTSVPQMAAHYLSEIRKVQPHGPYHLGGYCFGGLVAFEMAQQLRRRGDEAPVVAMFSAPLRFHRLNRKQASTAPGPDKLNGASNRFTRLLRSPRQALRWRIVSLIRTVRSRIHMSTCKLFLHLGLKVPQALRTMYVVRMIQQAEQNYAPQPYPGSLTLFRGHGLYENDPNMGWDGLAANLENHEIGDNGLRTRRDIMNEPLVGSLANELRACLDKVQRTERVKVSSLDKISDRTVAAGMAAVVMPRSNSTGQQ